MKLYQREETIINFMGWQNLPVLVALDAINTIVRNNLATIADCYGEIPQEEESELNVLYDLINNKDTTQDNMWASLYIEDFSTLNDIEGQKAFISLREEITNCMEQGMFFKDARQEWDI